MPSKVHLLHSYDFNDWVKIGKKLRHVIRVEPQKTLALGQIKRIKGKFPGASLKAVKVKPGKGFVGQTGWGIIEMKPKGLIHGKWDIPWNV
jgi:hypothetical protein